tara:strand:- start:262 stop:510 length:249 start_codon:yes stop_codon:yes gene_type:complete
MASQMKAILAINPDAQITITDGVIDWLDTTPISNADIEAKQAELDTAKANEKQAKIDLKASAKAKLISGEALTEDEANTIVL